MKPNPVATNVPLSLATAANRGELNSPNPAIALAVALVAGHALTGRRVRALPPTAIAPGGRGPGVRLGGGFGRWPRLARDPDRSLCLIGVRRPS